MSFKGNSVLLPGNYPASQLCDLVGVSPTTLYLYSCALKAMSRVTYIPIHLTKPSFNNRFWKVEFITYDEWCGRKAA